MAKHKKKVSFLKRFKNDKQGTMAVMWGASLMAVVTAVGSAYDYNKVSNARQQSLATADMLALTAAVYIRDNGEKPSSSADGFKNNTKYYLEDLGITLDPYADNRAKQRGAEGRNNDREAPYFKIRYDFPEKGMVTASIHGQTRPAFMGIVGIDNVDFSSASTVSYQVNDIKQPASIGLVLDNSGSMGWDDGNGTIRMTGLQTTVGNFMASVDTIIAETTEAVGEVAGLDLGLSSGTSENDVIRTNMITYNSNIVSEHLFDWSTIPSYKINGMTAGGGTNSSGAMDRMVARMAAEDQIHMDVNGAIPLKYVIFMTDGVNNTTHYENCVTIEGHWHWYHKKNKTISETYQSGKNWKKVWVYDNNEHERYNEEQQTCDEVSSYDAATVSSCNQMKASGVKIHSIGYALDEKPNDSDERKAELERANSMLASCSSGPEYFHQAGNAELLDQVFENIGEDIVEDTIRIRE